MLVTKHLWLTNGSNEVWFGSRNTILPKDLGKYMQMVCVKDITSAKNMVIEKMFHNRSVYIIENYTEAYKKITMLKIVF